MFQWIIILNIFSKKFLNNILILFFYNILVWNSRTKVISLDCRYFVMYLPSTLKLRFSHWFWVWPGELVGDWVAALLCEGQPLASLLFAHQSTGLSLLKWSCSWIRPGLEDSRQLTLRKRQITRWTVDPLHNVHVGVLSIGHGAERDVGCATFLCTHPIKYEKLRTFKCCEQTCRGLRENNTEWVVVTCGVHVWVAVICWP